MTDGSTALIAGSQVHYRRYGAEFDGPPLVFLHEGLGSVELWRDFPRDIVTTARCPGLAYSRHGNGWSTPLADPRRVDYMHEEALETLPRLIDELVGRPPILIGHSDGASIAIIYAGTGHPVEGLVLIAPHVFIEPEAVQSIRAIRESFPDSDMVEKMAKYHTDPNATFYGWADIWLSTEFRSWNIEKYLPGINRPILLIQGDADEYGTVEQLDAIERGSASSAERVMVADAGHSPHLSHPELVTPAVIDFIHRHF